MNELPITPPKVQGDLLKALISRRTRREFTQKSLTSQEFQALCFAACGVSKKELGHKLRTAPSAGACYPIELYSTVSQIIGVNEGVWKAFPEQEKLKLLRKGSFNKTLSQFALGQKTVAQAGINFILVFNPSKIKERYGDQAKQYGILECGHIAQNILLMAESLDLGAVPIGGFEKTKISQLLNLPKTYEVIYIISIGKKLQKTF